MSNDEPEVVENGFKNEHLKNSLSFNKNVSVNCVFRYAFPSWDRLSRSWWSGLQGEGK